LLALALQQERLETVKSAEFKARGFALMRMGLKLAAALLEAALAFASLLDASD